ncbi:hypothetical protein [Neomoorella thermoacetica]|uniref:hypothetical protein n=1 Tax=Neomoorella thermoacetica TaxID=1525 RepID=UPI0008FAB018|nr:hypothetical protein [Moorella thermoacetica]OIQ11847.1 hypothetical protein MOOTH_12390 [Moorella thermoacetica]
MKIILPEFLRWQPGAEQWAVPVSAWDTDPTSYLRLRRVLLDGRPVAGRNIIFPGVMPVYLLPAGARTSDPAAYLATLGREDKRYACSWLILKTAGLSALQVTGGEHSLELEFITFAGMTCRAATTILLAPLPAHHHWQPVELQMHNSSHDDGHWSPAAVVKELVGRGYRALYFTPHADLIAGFWEEFAGLCQDLSGTIAVFPGLELTTRNSAGHLLLYGLTALEGWQNARNPGQVIIDRVNRLPGHTASVTVSHPFGRPPWPWEDEPVVDYSGLEVFSGLQWYFDLESRPLQLWRREVARLSGRVFLTGYLPSARAGSDWHQVLPYQGYVTYVYLPDSWAGLPWQEQKYFLDLALRRGYTVASRRGGLAYFLINGQPPGTSVTLPPGAILEIKIYWQGVVEGDYQFLLFQGYKNMGKAIWQAETRGAGGGRRPAWKVELAAPGETSYYWLYVSGPDQVLTSPVFLRPARR